MLPFFPALAKRLREALLTFREGFCHGLRQCGLIVSKKTLPVELWKWETMHDDEVCEDCRERASWPAMDIADWMKEGLPRTPEAETCCGRSCRCELVRHHPPGPKALL